MLLLSSSPFCHFFGSLFSPKKASTARRPEETEILPGLPRPQPLGPSVQSAGQWPGVAQQRGAFYQQRWALMSQTHPVTSDDGYDFLAVCQGTKLPWAGCTVRHVFMPRIILPSWFHRAEGLHAFLDYLLTVVPCGRYYCSPFYR